MEARKNGGKKSMSKKNELKLQAVIAMVGIGMLVLLTKVLTKLNELSELEVQETSWGFWILIIVTIVLVFFLCSICFIKSMKREEKLAKAKVKKRIIRKNKVRESWQNLKA